MSKERLAQVIQNKIKTVLVDLKQGDKPVELIMYNDTQFRTIKDGHLCNNFNKLKAIKLVSANKLKVKKWKRIKNQQYTMWKNQHKAEHLSI